MMQFHEKFKNPSWKRGVQFAEWNKNRAKYICKYYLPLLISMESIPKKGTHQQASPEVFRPCLYGANNLFFWLYEMVQYLGTSDIYPVASYVIKPIARSIMQAQIDSGKF